MGRYRLLPDTFSASDGADPAYDAETVDEYRELSMLANAWERASLDPGRDEEGASRADDCGRDGLAGTLSSGCP